METSGWKVGDGVAGAEGEGDNYGGSMKDMKLVMLSDGEYDGYGIIGLYWVPKECDAHRVIAEAIEAKYGGFSISWKVEELIPSDWKVASYQEVHITSTYWNEIGFSRLALASQEAEVKKYAGMTEAQIKKAKEQEAAKAEADFIARGGVRLTREALLTDRTGDMLRRCQEIASQLADKENREIAKLIAGAV